VIGLDSNLNFLVQFRHSITRGEGMKAFLIRFASENHGPLSHQIAALLIAYQQRKENYDNINESLERKLVLDLAWRCLKGEPVGHYLYDLERELEISLENKLELFIKALPIKVLLAVIFFQFPALIILAMLPVFHQILEVVK
jgi:hypothetical protein